MSVGYRNEKDPFICLGEYYKETNKNQISVINIFDNSIQYILSNKDNRSYNWKIIFARILKGSSNCVSLAKKDSNQLQSKLAFWKFTQEQFLSEVIIDEDVRYCSFNPKNTYELVLCGKNYLRLWNVFINQGILREHPQRFLKSKQEKDYTFINIDYFNDRKAFTYIVGTLENVIFVIEGFIVIAKIHCGYLKENIFELNLQNFITVNDENVDDDNSNNKNMNASRSMISHTNNFKDNDSKYKSLSQEELLTEHKKKNYSNINSINPLNKTKNNFNVGHTDDISSLNYCNSNTSFNPLRCVKLVGNNQILVTFQNDSISYIYTKMERDIKNAVFKKEEGPSEENSNNYNRKGVQEEIKVERLANNIKQIINVSINEDGSKIIYLVEVYGKNIRNETTLRLLLFNKKGYKIIFEKEIFRNFISSLKLKKFEINEKKQNFFTLNENNLLKCFDFRNSSFLLQHQFKDEPIEVVSCPNNNIIGISFKNRFSLFFLLKEKITPFMDFDILNSNGKFSEKGEILVISGCNPLNKLYSIMFLDAFNFNIIQCIENVKFRVKKFIFMDNDKYLFVLFENSFVRGYSLHLDSLSINLMQRFKDRSKSVSSSFINLFYKHSPKGDYHDFDYDFKYDLLVVAIKNQEKVYI